MTRDTASGEAGGQCLWFPGLFGTGRENGLAEGSSAIMRLDMGLPKRMLNTGDAPGFRPENLPLHPEQMAALAGEFQLLASESARGSGALNEAAMALEREREEARAREERAALARLGQHGHDGQHGQDGQDTPGSIPEDGQALELARRRAQRTLLLLWLEEKQAREMDELMGRVEKGFSQLGEAFLADGGLADGHALSGQAGPFENDRNPLARWKVMLKAAVLLCPKDAIYVLETPVLTDANGSDANGPDANGPGANGPDANGTDANGTVADGTSSPTVPGSQTIPEDLLELFGRARSCPLAESVGSKVGRAARSLEIGLDELFPELCRADGKGAVLPDHGPLRLVFLEGRV